MIRNLDPGHQVGCAQMLATVFHDLTQKKYGDVPYIAHPKALVEKAHQDPEHPHLTQEEKQILKQVLWLHDVVEDTPCTLAMLLDDYGFDERVVFSVGAMTRRSGVTRREYIGAIIDHRLPFPRIAKRVDVRGNQRGLHMLWLTEPDRANRLRTQYEEDLVRLDAVIPLVTAAEERASQSAGLGQISTASS